jgi:hypothetical protein
MPRNYKPVDPSKVVKIECFELPQHREPNEGEYELRWANRPEEFELHDLFSLERELKNIMPDRIDDIVTRIQNFRVVYINMQTGEITT